MSRLQDACPVYILCGPTGVGKSQMGAKIADKYKGEVLSADSRQIYAGLDVGTAKLSPSERKVRHHLLDLVRPDELFSAQDFCRRALMILNELKEKKIKPFVVGGTGLYLKALTEGLFQGTGRVSELRKRWEKKPLSELYAKLAEIDPPKARRLSKNDRPRIERALEIFYAHGKPMSELEKKRLPPAGFEFLWAGLELERDELYRRIDERVEKQLVEGWMEEVRRLKEAGFGPDWPAFKTIGYQEVYRHLAGELGYFEMLQLIKRKTRNYAKRQLTWFRHQAPAKWFDAADPQAQEKIEKLWKLN